MPALECQIYGIPETDKGHRHAHAHILLPLNEAMSLRLDDLEYRITSKHFGFVAPGKFHHCMGAKQVLQINIPPSMIKARDIDILSEHISIPASGIFAPLVELIKCEVQQNPNSKCLNYLYYYLYNKMVEHGSIKSIRYIREHYTQDISVARLAELENYNVTYFTDWFKRQTGSTPSQYIREIRMEKAVELLVSTQYRLVDIASQVGYNSDAAFSRAFKEVIGVAPVDYRRNGYRQTRKKIAI